MNQNDMKQLIIDTMRENGQMQVQDKPGNTSPQRQEPVRKNSDNFSKIIIIFQSLLMLITSIFVKYMELVHEVDVSDLKIPMVGLYGSSIGFFQLRKGLEHFGRLRNAQPGKREDDSGEYEEFD
jgi:hypothetical protein